MSTMRVQPRKLTEEERQALPGKAANRTHLKVRVPGSGLELPTEGMEVPMVAYWLRRRREGSVLEITTPTAESSPRSSSPTAGTRARGTKSTPKE